MNHKSIAIEKNEMCELVDFPKGKTNIGVKWVYKRKLKEKRKIEKHKGNLVAKGFS